MNNILILIFISVVLGLPRGLDVLCLLPMAARTVILFETQFYLKIPIQIVPNWTLSRSVCVPPLKHKFNNI